MLLLISANFPNTIFASNLVVENSTWFQTSAKLLYLTYFQIHTISTSFCVPSKSRFATSKGICKN